MSFLDDYEPVEDRITKFYADHPNGRITTSLLHYSEREYIVHAAAYRQGEDVPAATGLAQEIVGATPVNKMSALENCETSAIGRALANLGYAAKGRRPSREEMAKVGGHRSSEQTTPPPSGGHQCPACGSRVYDNRAENYGTKKPLWKCGNKACRGGKDGKWPWASWDDDPFLNETVIREDFPPDEYVPDPDLEAPF